VYDTIFVEVSYNGGQSHLADTVRLAFGRPDILVVNDDYEGKYEQRYLDDLDRYLQVVDVWRIIDLGPPPPSTLEEYEVVIWYTGDSASQYINPSEVDVIKDYLDAGGNLFLTGQGIALDLHQNDPAFLSSYLHAQLDQSQCADEDFTVWRFPTNSQITSSISHPYFFWWFLYTNMDESEEPQINNQVCDSMIRILPIWPAVPELEGESYTCNPDYSALSYAGSQRLVYLNFGYEAIWDTKEQYWFFYMDRLPRRAFLRYILDFLRPTGLDFTCSDQDNDGYGDPSQPGMRCYLDDCPDLPNFMTITDWDKDGLGSHCDNCDGFNPQQADSDGDGIGDLCDYCPGIFDEPGSDPDRDKIGNACDNCPGVYNRVQIDSDGDSFGNPCDNCPDIGNSNQADDDSDGVGDICDICPNTPDPKQIDVDEDTIGDACDNCPEVSNTDQLDTDEDGVGNMCDNCPLVFNPAQTPGNDEGVGCTYILGDANGDGFPDVGDAVFLINHVFKSGPEPVPLESGDANCDGEVNVGDAVYLINFVFKGGQGPCLP
jgi:hypothetical protein